MRIAVAAEALAKKYEATMSVYVRGQGMMPGGLTRDAMHKHFACNRATAELVGGPAARKAIMSVKTASRKARIMRELLLGAVKQCRLEKVGSDGLPIVADCARCNVGLSRPSPSSRARSSRPAPSSSSRAAARRLARTASWVRAPLRSARSHPPPPQLLSSARLGAIRTRLNSDRAAGRPPLRQGAAGAQSDEDEEAEAEAE